MVNLGELTYYYYYSCLTASFPRQPGQAKQNRQQKGRIILDFNEAKDDGMAVTSAGPYADHLHLTIDR